MIHKMALSLTEKFVEAGIVVREQKYAYAYGFELMLSSLFGVSLLIVISIIFGKPFLWFPYLIGYVLLRTNTGGYHARSHWFCITLFASVFAVYLLLFDFLVKIKFLPVICCTICLITVLLFAPVDTPNNPLYPDQRVKRRKLSIVIAVMNLLIALILTVFIVQENIIVASYYMGVTVATFFFIATGIAQKHKGGKKNES